MKATGYSLARRLSLQLAWQTALGLSVLCAGIFAATAWSFADKQRAHLATKLAATVDSARSADRTGGLAEMRRQLQAAIPRRAGTYLELRTVDGDLLYRDPEALQNIAKAQRLDVTLSLSEGEVRGALFLDTTEDQRMLARLALILAIATVLGGVSAGVASAWRVRRTMQPLRALADQTRAISPERMDQPLSLADPVAELQPWIDQFNAMLRRLESAYVQLEAFNADVAHELRTPLAALIGHTEVALSREDRPAHALRETLMENLEELHRISTLVNDMLFLSRADRGALARRGSPASLAALARQVADYHEAPLSEARLRLEIIGDAHTAVDDALFKRALSNLLGNATRFGLAGSAITLHIEVKSDEVEVSVENAGPDIDAPLIPRLFDRLFRIDESRADGHLHQGLGLAIVAAIARMHAGRTFAVSAGGRTRIGFSVRHQDPDAARYVADGIAGQRSLAVQADEPPTCEPQLGWGVSGQLGADPLGGASTHRSS
jgi:two-component system heavy metal sensor histidine kinase CusS